MIFNLVMKSKDPNSLRAKMNPYVATVVTALLSLVVIVVLGTVYAKLAQILTDNENHKRLTQYEGKQPCFFRIHWQEGSIMLYSTWTSYML